MLHNFITINALNTDMTSRRTRTDDANLCSPVSTRCLWIVKGSIHHIPEPIVLQNVIKLLLNLLKQIIRIPILLS